MATPATGVKYLVLKIPKGKFWIGKSLPAGTSTQLVNFTSLAVIIKKEK
jgi:hypothetical protein